MRFNTGWDGDTEMEDVRIAAAVVPSRVGEVGENLERMEHWCDHAQKKGAALICFPELNITGYTTRRDIRMSAQPLSGAIGTRLINMAQAAQMIVLAGMAECDRVDNIYATHLVVTPDGQIWRYRKLHLAPPEQVEFTSGSNIPVFKKAGMTFGVQLCYDAHFPELSTRMALCGVDVIFIPHASPRDTPEKKFASWMRHLPARAYDNSVYIIACNPCGENGLGLSFAGLAVAIGPSGNVIQGYLENREGVLLVDLKGDELTAVRSHRMRYFLPNRRPEIYTPADIKSGGEKG